MTKHNKFGKLIFNHSLIIWCFLKSISYMYTFFSTICTFLLSKYRSAKGSQSWQCNQIAIKNLYKLRNKYNSYHYNKCLLQIRKINPYLFEEIIIHLFIRQNYKLVFKNQYSRDGGVDGKIKKWWGRKYIIQTKRHKGYLRMTDIDNFLLTMEKHKVKYGFFIHTGLVSNKIIKQIPRNITLLYGKKLVKFVLDS